MRVLVLYFSELREITGTGDEEWEIPEGADARGLWRCIGERYPKLAALPYDVRPAVEESYAGWDTPIREGDRVAFLAPPGGG
jgi:molybdopterin synthase sulfur carrier subunit